MTDEEIFLVLEAEQFFHVTGRSLQVAVEANGLDPDKGRQTCAGRDQPCVFLATKTALEKSVKLAGTKYHSEKELAIYRIPANVLIDKRLGPDKTWQTALPSIEESLTISGNLSCFDLIAPGEFDLVEIRENLDYFFDDLANAST